MQKLVYIVKPSSDPSLWQHILNLVPKINSEFETSVILIQPEFFKIDLSQKLPFKMTVVRHDKKRPKATESYVKTILDEEKPHLVHTIGTIGLGLKKYLSTQFKERWVHTVYTTEDNQLPFWQRLFGKGAAREAWSVFLTEAERGVQKKGIQRKSSVISPAALGPVMPAFNDTQSTLLILSPLTIDPFPAVASSLRLVALLRLVLVDININVVAPKSCHAQILELVEDLKLTGCATTLLEPKDFLEALTQSRLVIKLAPEAIFDDRLAIAMRAGRPVILNSDDYFSKVTQGHSGVFTFKSTEQYSLSQTIKKLFTETNFYAESALAAASTANQIFSQDKISLDHLVVYKMLS